jgi:hypothetical protein
MPGQKHLLFIRDTLNENTGTVREFLGVRPDALFGTAAFIGPKEPACAGEMLPFFINPLSRAFQGVSVSNP